MTLGETAEPKAAIALKRAHFSTIGTSLTPTPDSSTKTTNVIILLLPDTILPIQREINLPQPERFEQPHELGQ